MKKIAILLVLLVVVLVSAIVYFSSKTTEENVLGETPDPTATGESPLSSPIPRPNITKVPVPLPTGDGRTSFIGETVPWNLLSADASCQLKGEVKFLDHNTYDNQDALFVYTGVDHPARIILWTVTPQDDISVGPNIFNKTPIPDGESLLGIVLPDDPKYKKYELTAKINYGRLVNGNVKVFEKQCDGKTTVVLP